MKTPFPFFGGKARVADLVWERFGSVANYVEPFFGSGAVLLGRPTPFGGTETVNDLDEFIANFWRALAAEPEQVASYADWPAGRAVCAGASARVGRVGSGGRCACAVGVVGMMSTKGFVTSDRRLALLEALFEELAARYWGDGSCLGCGEDIPLQSLGGLGLQRQDEYHAEGCPLLPLLTWQDDPGPTSEGGTSL